MIPLVLVMIDGDTRCGLKSLARIMTVATICARSGGRCRSAESGGKPNAIDPTSELETISADFTGRAGVRHPGGPGFIAVLPPLNITRMLARTGISPAFCTAAVLRPSWTIGYQKMPAVRRAPEEMSVCYGSIRTD